MPHMQLPDSFFVKRNEGDRQTRDASDGAVTVGHGRWRGVVCFDGHILPDAFEALARE